MATSRRALTVLWAALLLSLSPPAARALTFSSSVERFEADGNAYGSADGVFDLVDEFDDGTLAPGWELLLGTAVESGGRLTLRDPGVNVPLVGLAQELSVVESAVELENGEGDFTITSHWDPTPLPVNRQFFFQIYGEPPGVIEASGMTVNHFDAAQAAASGAPVGLSIGRQRFFPFGEEPGVQDYAAIDPLDVTGAIVLRLSFDDTTDLLTCSFSLDGGVTFQSPFAPLQAFKRNPGHEIFLGAAALPPAPPPPSPCTGAIERPRAKFRRLNRPPGAQQVSMKGVLRFPPGQPAIFDPPLVGMAFAAVSVSAGVQASFAPPGGTSTCGSPGDGWRLKGATHRYANTTGVIPPTCFGGSANGLRAVKVRPGSDGIRVVLTARDTMLAVPPPDGGAALVVYTSSDVPQALSAGSCAQALLTCTSSASTVSCK